MGWIASYNKATKRTKNFVLTCILYGLVLILSTVYCYVRLDYVRIQDKQQHVKKSDNKKMSNINEG